MRYAFQFATLALAAVGFGLSGCGSSDEASIAPPAAVTIAAPAVSAVLPNSTSSTEQTVSGTFVTSLTTAFELAPKLIASPDAQQTFTIHLNRFADVGSVNSELRSGNFATLAANGNFVSGTMGTTHPIRSVLANRAGLNYVSFGQNRWHSSVVRANVVPLLTELFVGTEDEVAVGQATNGEFFAARLTLAAGNYVLETRKTVGGAWGAVERSAVTLPAQFSPDRTTTDARFRLERYALKQALSGVRGDAFILSLTVSREPLNGLSPIDNGVSGTYLLWRERGSAELRVLGFKALCVPFRPTACLFDENYAFQNLSVEANGEITYLSDDFDSNSPNYGSRWLRAENTPLRLWRSPFTGEQPGLPLRRKDRADFALTADGLLRSWTLNGNAIVLLEGVQGATPAPVTWATANGELAPCAELVRCRVFRAESVDRLAYLAWDKATRRATLYISDRAADGNWRNVATRDISEVVSDLDATGDVELSAFLGAGASDLVIGATRNGERRDRVRLFALSITPRRNT